MCKVSGLRCIANAHLHHGNFKARHKRYSVSTHCCWYDLVNRHVTLPLRLVVLAHPCPLPDEDTTYYRDKQRPDGGQAGIYPAIQWFDKPHIVYIMRYMYELLFADVVTKQQARLPRREREKIMALLLGLREQPRPFRCKKLAGGTQEYRIRYGDWRILYAVDDRRHQVVVYGILHRKEAYR